jgi:hypothetical protein
MNPQLSTQPQRKEVQAHGFTWEEELKSNVYGMTLEECKSQTYTGGNDVPATCNHKDGCNVSIKVTGSPNAVCMADCLRVYDAVSSGEIFHLTVVTYKQNDARKTKCVQSIVEVDLTNATSLLFGTLTRAQIEALDKLIKAVPAKRKPTEEERNAIYALRDTLQEQCKAIHLDPKCNSQQSRLQCSFNRFVQFIKDHPERCIAQSDSNEFRGGKITCEIVSGRRVFKKKKQSAAPPPQEAPPAAHSEPH